MSASALQRCALAALAVALLGIACRDASRDRGVNPAAEPPTGAVRPAAASVPSAPPSPEAPPPSAPQSPTQRAVEDRAAAVLDTEPSGAGLDTLMRSAKSDPDASVREAAVVALGDSDDPRALDALVAAAADPDKRVVLAAIDQLGWFDDRPAHDALERLTRSPDAEIAGAATDALED